MRSRTLLAATVVITGVLALAGCSSDDDSGSSTTTTSGKEAVCAARSDLEQSVRALTDLSLSSSGKSSVESAVDDVKQDLDDLGETAKQTYKPQVDALQSAIDDLQDAVQGIGNGSISQDLETIGNAIADVGRTAGDLADDLRADCPSG
jgi:hypothetical protein